MTAAQIRELQASGVEIKTRDGAPWAPKGARPPGEEVKLLLRIADLLEDLLEKPAPKIEAPAAPKIVVEPTQITLETVTKWKFELKKDSQGRTTEIIATAVNTQ